MVKITLEVPEDLGAQLERLGDRLPEVLSQSLVQPPIPAHVYRYVLEFLASHPTPKQITEFRPTPEMQDRLRLLVSRSQSGDLTERERQELDDYERIEHVIVMMKTGALSYLQKGS